MAEELEPQAAAKPRSSLWKTLLKLLVSAALIYLILRMVNLRDLGQVFQQANWPLLVGSFLLFCFSQVLRALRWHILVACHRPGISFLASLNALFVSFFFNMFLPAELGGDVVRGLWLDREVGSRSASFASVLADRIMGMLTMAVLATGSIIRGSGHISPHSVIMVLAVCAGLLLFAAAVASERVASFFLGLPIIPKRFDLAGRLQRFSEAVRLYRSQRRPIAWAIVWSFLFQAAIYVSYYYLAMALRMPCPLWSFFAFVPLITIMTMVPASLNGIGAREAGYVFFFHEVQLNATQATSLSLASYAFIIGISLLGGLVYLLQRDNRSARGPRQADEAIRRS